MKRYSLLDNYRTSICQTEIITQKEKQNIYRSIRSIRSFSKNYKKPTIKYPLKDSKTLEPLTPKTHRYSCLPLIHRLHQTPLIQKAGKHKIRQISSSQEISFHKFMQVLEKKNGSIEVQLHRLDSLTQNYNKLMCDLSKIQQKKIIEEYKNGVRSSIPHFTIEL